MQLRTEKSIARFLALMFAPEGGAVVKAFRTSLNGRIKIPDEFEQARKNSGLGDKYVLVYESELHILYCLIRAILPEKHDSELKEFIVAYEVASEEERLEFFRVLSESLLTDDIYEKFRDLIPRTEEARKAAKEKFENLSEDEKKEVIRQVHLFLAFYFSAFYNYISVMVHGQKLTKLVSRALQGDQEAFCKAVQIDKNLLTGHPYFQETFARLPMGNDKDRNFHRAICSAHARPQVNSRIDYPALYLLFAVLDSFGWLDSFTAPEILDLCDEARLDRYQNRIEDENYLTKRRLEYRKKQKTGF
ncbi:hypothetical protein HS096_07060 [candidate division WWE3 bacterium]|uniref:Uncharacterized protein n=1 Tax=candidate division WWE3 bacterium TaxID=2053526 RepID=A0A928TRK5_UNCKA|nr:hypothetical protein [candidate division WWE3 bacterium]